MGRFETLSSKETIFKNLEKLLECENKQNKYHIFWVKTLLGEYKGKNQR